MSHTIVTRLKRVQDELVTDGVDRLDPDAMAELEQVIYELDSRSDGE